MAGEDLRYFHEEVAEGGELFIAFAYLEREHGWTLEKFRHHVALAVEDGLCSFEKWAPDIDAAPVRLGNISFETHDDFRFHTFVPTPKARDYFDRFLAEKHSGLI